MQRLLKKHLGRFLPRELTHSLKRRSERKFEIAEPRLRCSLEETGTDIRCRIDGEGSFLAPPATRPDLGYFVADGRGRTEFQVLVEAARGAAVAFDIGAYVGVVSALFCAANPQLRVFSFEPSPVTAPRVEEIISLNALGERMSLQRVGIGGQPGTLEMLIDPVGGFVQTQRFDHTMWAAPEKIQVPIETIEGAAQRLGVHPTLIKLDIEGFEYEAIEGALEYLKRHQPTMLLEVHLNYLEQRGRSAEALVEMLLECGYTLSTYAGHKLKPAEVSDSPLSAIHLLLEAA